MCCVNKYYNSMLVFTAFNLSFNVMLNYLDSKRSLLVSDGSYGGWKTVN